MRGTVCFRTVERAWERSEASGIGKDYGAACECIRAAPQIQSGVWLKRRCVERICYGGDESGRNAGPHLLSGGELCEDMAEKNG